MAGKMEKNFTATLPAAKNIGGRFRNRTTCRKSLPNSHL
jgi:hypothetical protein